jgi:folate-dependent phosphoribosylglycinamide formyltransferase PurN
VPIHADDSLETLEARVHAAEHVLLVDTIRDWCTRAAERRVSTSTT